MLLRGREFWRFVSLGFSDRALPKKPRRQLHFTYRPGREVGCANDKKEIRIGSDMGGGWGMGMGGRGLFVGVNPGHKTELNR